MLYGIEVRSKALVVIGSALCGKSAWAGHHFGYERTFVADCQGMSEPPMTGFSRKNYRCLHLQDPGPEMWQRCKRLLQATFWGATLYESTCNGFAEWFNVSQLPIIITCNEWVKKDAVDPLGTWLNENTIRIEVPYDERMFTLVY